MYCRDTLCEYITNKRGVVLGRDACIYGEPAAFISTPQTYSLKLVLGGPPFKKGDSKLAWIWIVAIEFKTLAPG